MRNVLFICLTSFVLCIGIVNIQAMEYIVEVSSTVMVDAPMIGGIIFDDAAVHEMAASMAAPVPVAFEDAFVGYTIAGSAWVNRDGQLIFQARLTKAGMNHLSNLNCLGPVISASTLDPGHSGTNGGSDPPKLWAINPYTGEAFLLSMEMDTPIEPSSSQATTYIILDFPWQEGNGDSQATTYIVLDFPWHEGDSYSGYPMILDFPWPEDDLDGIFGDIVGEKPIRATCDYFGHSDSMSTNVLSNARVEHMKISEDLDSNFPYFSFRTLQICP